MTAHTAAGGSAVDFDLLYRLGMIFGWSLASFWLAWAAGPSGGAWLGTAVLGVSTGFAVLEMGRRLRRQESRIRKLEEELERRWRYAG
jgi:hypothetical protein